MPAIVGLIPLLISRSLPNPSHFLLYDRTQVRKDEAAIHRSKECVSVHDAHVGIHVVVPLRSANPSEGVDSNFFVYEVVHGMRVTQEIGSPSA